MSDYDPTQKAWSIMTKSRGGTVSVIRDLTEEQAAKIYERLDPFYGQTSTSVLIHKEFLTKGAFVGSSRSSGRLCSDGDIEIKEVFGPPSWEWFPKAIVYLTNPCRIPIYKS